jgi:hypothetical protein
MGIRERITAFVGGDELREQQAAMAQTVMALANAYEAGKYELPPAELVRQLSEYTSTSDVDFIVSLLGWEGSNLFAADIARERDYAIQQSQHAWRHSPLYQWSVWAWTNWGLGESIKITPVDEGAHKVWVEFWEADRNASVLGQDKIHALSEWLLVDGDRYLVHFASTVDGEDTIRSIPPSQFPEPPITDPNDNGTPLFYKRVWVDKEKAQRTLYYPDWVAFFHHPEMLEQSGLLPPDAVRADQPNGDVIGDSESPGTMAVIQHIAHNRKDETDLRGWPLGTISGPYQRAHKQFMEDRLAVAAGKAMYVRRKQVAAGSRGLDSIKSTLQSSLVNSGWQDSNTPSVAGATELDNKAVTTTDLPMTTGAADASNDNKMFSWMGLLGDGLFPTSAGLDTSRFATALTMDKNQAMLWSRYKSFLAQQFRNMVKIVLLFKEEYTNEKFSDKSSEVSIDTLSIVDFPPVVEALAQMFNQALTPLVEIGVMPLDAARGIAASTWLLLLQALGVENADELASLEAFGDGDESQGADEKTEAAISRAADAIAEAARRVGEGAE